MRLFLCLSLIFVISVPAFAEETAEPPLFTPDDAIVLASAETEIATPSAAAPTVSTTSEIVSDGAARCRQFADDVKDHTHIVVINGVDPFHFGKLNRFCRRIECAGFKNVHLFPMRGYWSAEKKICRIRQEDPDAKIVLAGYSWGANEVRGLCHSLNKKGVGIDLLVYMGGDMIGNRTYSRPENAGRVLNINAHGLALYGYDLFWNGEDVDGAKNVRLDAMHLGLPRRTDTLDIFLSEVADTINPPAVAPRKETPAIPVSR